MASHDIIGDMLAKIKNAITASTSLLMSFLHEKKWRLLKFLKMKDILKISAKLLRMKNSSQEYS